MSNNAAMNFAGAPLRWPFNNPISPLPTPSLDTVVRGVSRVITSITATKGNGRPFPRTKILKGATEAVWYKNGVLQVPGLWRIRVRSVWEVAA